jgi:hypothetical protein
MLDVSRWQTSDKFTRVGDARGSLADEVKGEPSRCPLLTQSGHERGFGPGLPSVIGCNQR